MLRRTISGAVVVPTAVVVVVLGVLQYRWTDQLREAASVRLADTLQMSMVNWHLNLFRDLSEICLALQDDFAIEDHGASERYLNQVTAWRAAATHPDLVRAIYVASAARTRPFPIRQMNLAARRFEEREWPSSLAILRDTLPASVAGLRDGAGDPPFADAFYNLGAVLANWRFEPDIPALIHPMAPSIGELGGTGGTGQPAAGWLVLQLDGSVLRLKVLPDLARQYFSGTDGLDYEVAVVSGSDSVHIIYTSDDGFGRQAVSDADGSMNVFGRAWNERDRTPMFVFHKPSGNKGPVEAVGISWFPPLRAASVDEDWRLVVRHRRGGSLGAFVAEMHRRDLAISFGALLLLVVGLALIVGASRRMQSLARLQLDFVTAVSHELRTPLAVIGSAADNIAHGIVQGAEQLTEYGTVIAGQARQLTSLVEQLLLFATEREGRPRCTMAPLPVSEAIAAALTSATGLAGTRDLTVEQDIQPDLPAVLGDREALVRCLQNLITNAMKYGGEEGWIRIRASAGSNQDGRLEVQVSVSDRGMGIDAVDLPHVFEPFYRSASAGARQIRGTGLGLSLARSSAEAMHGRLTVVSKPGEGSTFTLHLLSVEPSAREHVEPGAAVL